MSVPTLILTVGLPRSGKSTWARGQECPIVCPDAIRLALHGQPFIASAEPFVWAIARVMVRSLFGAGHTAVILDACNVSRKRRDEWLSTEWTTRTQLFFVPMAVCKQRARDDGRLDLLPVIDRMAAEWDSPTEEEENGR